MRRALIIGAGGHCRVVMSILTEIKTYTIAGIIDIGRSQLNFNSLDESIMSVPVLASETLEQFLDLNDLDLFLAIGDCNSRSMYWRKMLDFGFSMPNLLSPRAIIHQSARLGSGNIICAGAFIGPEAKIGSNNLINTYSILEHESSVGNNCHIAPRALVAGRSIVANNCFLGAGSVIIDAVSIADTTTLGAGAIVVKDIHKPNGLYVGVPARRLIKKSI